MWSYYGSAAGAGFSVDGSIPGFTGVVPTGAAGCKTARWGGWNSRGLAELNPRLCSSSLSRSHSRCCSLSRQADLFARQLPTAQAPNKPQGQPASKGGQSSLHLSGGGACMGVGAVTGSHPRGQHGGTRRAPYLLLYPSPPAPRARFLEPFKKHSLLYWF